MFSWCWLVSTLISLIGMIGYVTLSDSRKVLCFLGRWLVSTLISLIGMICYEFS
jgi:uncharacterized protein YebE (UPF0316 family)